MPLADVRSSLRERHECHILQAFRLERSVFWSPRPEFEPTFLLLPHSLPQENDSHFVAMGESRETDNENKMPHHGARHRADNECTPIALNSTLQQGVRQGKEPSVLSTLGPYHRKAQAAAALCPVICYQHSASMLTV